MSEANSEPFRVRLSIRWKIILPFVLLATLLGLGAVVLINRQLAQAEQVRYLRQLRDSGQQAADEIVRLEARLLEVERVLANTQGVPEAVALSNAEQLRSLLLQMVVNSDTDVAVVLDRECTSLLAVRRTRPDSAADYLSFLNSRGSLSKPPDHQHPRDEGQAQGKGTPRTGQAETAAWFGARCVYPTIRSKSRSTVCSVLILEKRGRQIKGISTLALQHHLISLTIDDDDHPLAQC
jgi:hypothetical protein